MGQAAHADPPSTWLLLGAKAGDNNQVLALAEALGWPYREVQIRNHPWELLVGRWPGGTLAGVSRAASSPLLPPWPELVISAGRRNEPVAQWLRRQNGGATRLVHIGRPWAALHKYDLIVTTPQYFLPTLPNIVHNHLPLHRVNPTAVAAEAAALAPQLAHLPRPYTVVLLGGNSGQFVFTVDKARYMGKQVNALVQAKGGSVLFTDSRRTPQQAAAAFRQEITVPHYAYSWSGPGLATNPYRAFLGLSDQFVVTGESMSMLAEAVAMGKPVAIFDLSDHGKPWWRWRHSYTWPSLSHRLAMALGPLRMRRDIARIQQRLVADGLAVWLGDNLQERVSAPAASEAATTALAVRRLFGCVDGELRGQFT